MNEVYNQGLAAGVSNRPSNAPDDYAPMSNDWNRWMGGHAAGVEIMNRIAEMKAALELAETALEHSKPQMAHYSEPVERHLKALDAVRAALSR